jgi:hypothetical protein
MHRLQGDVGSGKTVVALTAMLVVDNGYQAVSWRRRKSWQISTSEQCMPFSARFRSGTVSRVRNGQLPGAMCSKIFARGRSDCRGPTQFYEEVVFHRLGLAASTSSTGSECAATRTHPAKGES